MTAGNPYRRLVISDIHGCSRTLRALVEEKVNLTKKDHLYLLGDYIDRGPDSAGVLDYIISLIKTGYSIFPVRGNHEENLIKAKAEYDRDTFIHFVVKISKSANLLDENMELKKEFEAFISNLPYYYLTDGFVIVHAGLRFGIPNPFHDITAMLELRKTEPDEKWLQGRRVIHGHQVYPLNEIKQAVDERRSVIPLDGGCYYTKPHKIYDHTQTGHLCCMNLDTFDLIIQKNIEE